MVGVSTKGVIVGNMFMKEAKDDDRPIVDEVNIEGKRGEQPGSEVTLMEIEYLRNEFVMEMEDHLNRRLCGNHDIEKLWICF